MKLKEFKNTSYWKLANIVEYYDKSGKEISFTTEAMLRKALNKSVIEISKRKEGQLRILRITLEMEV